jgi:hypothetical protein
MSTLDSHKLRYERSKFTSKKISLAAYRYWARPRWLRAAANHNKWKQNVRKTINLLNK